VTGVSDGNEKLIEVPSSEEESESGRDNDVSVDSDKSDLSEFLFVETNSVAIKKGDNATTHIKQGGVEKGEVVIPQTQVEKTQDPQSQT